MRVPYRRMMLSLKSPQRFKCSPCMTPRNLTYAREAQGNVWALSWLQGRWRGSPSVRACRQRGVGNGQQTIQLKLPLRGQSGLQTPMVEQRRG
jgi:hypothetical protein